ncbi:MAG: glycosyltransferase family 4 protein, partial [Promethearchaeota archaeon]
RKCLIRVNEDTLIPLIFFLKSSRNFFFKNNILIRIVSKIYRRIENFLFTQVDWIVTHGPMDYEKIKKITDKITFIPLWIDLKRFKRLDPDITKKFSKNFVKEKNKKAILLFVGRLHPEKGVPTLFKALKLIAKKKFVLLMVYSFSQYKKEYEKLVTQLGITDNVLFYGYVSHKKLPIFYNISDLCILPSLREQWSNTLMESMACKTPIIVTKVGANPYIVEDGKSGFMVPPNDPISLAKKIEFVLENHDKVEKVIETAAIEIKKYDKNIVGENYKLVVKKLIR